MAGFGFDDDATNSPKVDLAGLKPGKSTRPASASKAKVAEDSTRLGFPDRRAVKPEASSSFKRKPGRKPPSEPKMPVMISGPESVMLAFKRYCEENGNLAYWEGLKLLMSKQEE